MPAEEGGQPLPSAGEAARAWITPAGCYALLDRLEAFVPHSDPDLARLPPEFFFLKGITYCQLASLKSGTLPQTALERLLEIGTDNLNRAVSAWKQPGSGVSLAQELRRFWLAAYTALKESGDPLTLRRASIFRFVQRKETELREVCSKTEPAAFAGVWCALLQEGRAQP